MLTILTITYDAYQVVLVFERPIKDMPSAMA